MTIKPRKSDLTSPEAEQYQEEEKRYCFDSQYSAFPLNEGETSIEISDLHYGVHKRKKVAGGKDHALREKMLTETIKQYIATHTHTVLNGDVFETIYPAKSFKNFENVVDYAKHIITELAAVAQTHDHKLHIVIGNHDDAPDLFEALEHIADQYPQHLYIHPVALRIGAMLYTHGDIPLRQHIYEDMNVESRLLGRENPMGKRFSQHLGSKWADFVIANGKEVNASVHKPVSSIANHIRSNTKLVNTLYQGLKDSKLMRPMTTADGVDLPYVSDVITGHSHTPYLNLTPTITGAPAPRFHNSGSAVEKDLFLPIVVTGGKDHSVADISAPTVEYEQEIEAGITR